MSNLVRVWHSLHSQKHICNFLRLRQMNKKLIAGSVYQFFSNLVDTFQCVLHMCTLVMCLLSTSGASIMYFTVESLVVPCFQPYFIMYMYRIRLNIKIRMYTSNSQL